MLKARRSGSIYRAATEFDAIEQPWPEQSENAVFAPQLVEIVRLAASHRPAQGDRIRCHRLERGDFRHRRGDVGTRFGCAHHRIKDIGDPVQPLPGLLGDGERLCLDPFPGAKVSAPDQRAEHRQGRVDDRHFENAQRRGQHRVPAGVADLLKGLRRVALAFARHLPAARVELCRQLQLQQPEVLQQLELVEQGGERRAADPFVRSPQPGKPALHRPGRLVYQRVQLVPLRLCQLSGDRRRRARIGGVHRLGREALDHRSAWDDDAL